MGIISRTFCSGGGGTFTRYSDSSMTQNAVTMSNGTVTSVTVDTTLGRGYTAPVTLTVSVNVTSAGTGYTTAPTLTVSGGLTSSVTTTKTAGIGQRADPDNDGA